MLARALRQRPHVDYYEPEEPEFDEYIYCEHCSDYVFEYCAIHGPLLVIPDDKVSPKPNFPSFVPRAALTIPQVFLHLAPSITPGAGIGVFSTLTLPRGVRFGPYRGQLTDSVDSMYCWQIFGTNNKRLHVIDAADSEHSNWMRYVNCSRHWTEQNLVAYQYKGQLYYRTIKIIPRFTELLVFYGSEFANVLRINVSKYNHLPYYKPNINPNEKIEDTSRSSTDSEQVQSVSEKIVDQKLSNSDEKLLNFNDFQIIDSPTNEVDDSVLRKNVIVVTDSSKTTIDNNLKQNFQCEHCNKWFLKKTYLKRHSLSHLPTQKYQCQQCSYTTSFSYTFKRHSLTHSNHVYSCEMCSYKTNERNRLIAHLCYQNNNIKSKSYYRVARSCEICQFSTFSKKSFQTHMLKHKGTKYQCQLCDYNNYSKANFGKHLLRKHKEVITM